MKLHRHFFEGYFSQFEEYILSHKHRVYQYAPGEYLFQNMLPNPKVNMYFYIYSGHTMVHTTTTSGARKILCYYASGTFPNMDLNGNAFRCYEYEMVEALTDTTVLIFEKETMHEMIKNNLDFTIAALNFYGELVALLSYQAMVLPYIPAEVRLCDFLFLSYAFAPRVQHLNPQYVFASQEQIAQYIGVTRTQVSRLLKKLKEENLIETRRGCINILDLEKIQAKCSSSVRPGS